MKSKYEVKVGFAGALLMAMNDGSANSTRFDIPEALGPSLSENFSSNGRLSSLRLPPSPFEDLPVDIFVANVCHKMNFTGDFWLSMSEAWGSYRFWGYDPEDQFCVFKKQERVPHGVNSFPPEIAMKLVGQNAIVAFKFPEKEYHSTELFQLDQFPVVRKVFQMWEITEWTKIYDEESIEEEVTGD
eukprot:GHVP01053990.1.p1 GENE.GHVP01053990.1~~GHVP01053990.1.p1  ORF type:complete len:198 (+),score=40.70 GHVP01053990.1:39-596(+)